MAAEGIAIPNNCPVRAQGQHFISKPTWSDKVHATVITCTSCGEQWIVNAERAKA